MTCGGFHHWLYISIFARPEMFEPGLLLAALAVGPMGNLRHDSALMGALTSTKGKQAMPERVPVSAKTPFLDVVSTAR